MSQSPELARAVGQVSLADVLTAATEYGKRLCDVFAHLTPTNTRAAADAEIELQDAVAAYAEGYAFGEYNRGRAEALRELPERGEMPTEVFEALAAARAACEAL